MKRRKTEPCLSKCKFLRSKDNQIFCALYDMTELEQDTISDPYDDGFVLVPFKCEDCTEKELSTLIDNKLQEIKDMYNVFVYEMDLLFSEMDELQERRRSIYKED